MLYKAPGGADFKPLPGVSAYGTAKDTGSAVSFPAVTVTALRLEAQLQDGFSGGILHWSLNRIDRF